MKKAVIAIVLALTVSTFNVLAQDAGVSATVGGSSTGSSFSGAMGHGQGGHHQRPNPAQLAAFLMKRFDANKDGELEQGELTQAIEAIRKHHRQCAGGQGGQNHGQAASSQQQGAVQSGSAGGGQRHHHPAGEVAAHMIAKYAADKKGLTLAELTQAIAAHHAHHSQPGGSGQPSGVHSDGLSPHTNAVS